MWLRNGERRIGPSRGTFGYVFIKAGDEGMAMINDKWKKKRVKSTLLYCSSPTLLLPVHTLDRQISSSNKWPHVEERKQVLTINNTIRFFYTYYSGCHTCRLNLKVINVFGCWSPTTEGFWMELWSVAAEKKFSLLYADPFNVYQDVYVWVCVCDREVNGTKKRRLILLTNLPVVLFFKTRFGVYLRLSVVVDNNIIKIIAIHAMI